MMALTIAVSLKQKIRRSCRAENRNAPNIWTAERQLMKANALIFLGPPGAGKGTQARIASSHFSVPQVSTGEILRNAVRNKTAIGMIAKLRMDAGELLPDEVVCSL